MGEYVDENNQCKECLSGQNLIIVGENNEGPCNSCDPESQICRGGPRVGVKAGYWRLNSTADIFLKCPANDACLASELRELRDGSTTVEAVGLCNTGYQGHLCH